LIHEVVCALVHLHWNLLSTSAGGLPLENFNKFKYILLVSLLLLLLELLLGEPEVNLEWLRSKDVRLLIQFDGVLSLLNFLIKNISVLELGSKTFVGLSIKLSRHDVTSFTKHFNKLLLGHSFRDKLDVNVGVVGLLQVTGDRGQLVALDNLVVLLANVSAYNKMVAVFKFLLVHTIDSALGSLRLLKVNITKLSKIAILALLDDSRQDLTV